MRTMGQVALAALSLGLFGCVTAASEHDAGQTAPIEAERSADTPTPIDGELAAAVDSLPVSAEKAVAGDPSLDWQKTLTDDVDQVEAKGDAFLDASFKLYDQLLAEGTKGGAPGDSPGSPPSDALSNAVNASAGLYADLTAAVDRLHHDLARPEVQGALPLKGDDGQRELAATLDLFKTYKLVQRHTVAYDTGSGPTVTQLVFGDAERTEAGGLGDLPKPKRDALVLLDSLRQISNDLAYVSHTVTDWVDVRDDVAADETAADQEELTH